jgi:anthranilate synthase component II
MILIIDNYDSFVYNIDRYIRRLGQETEVVRNDKIGAEEILQRGYSAILISPGPQTPNEAGNSLNIIERCESIPILGVCLGHQAIGQAFGGKVVRAPRPIHGQTSLVRHAGDGIFAGVPNPMQVARYHSLVVDHDTLPQSLEPLATCDPNLIMAFKHKERPVWGVQFHPESIMTIGGFRLLANFLSLTGHRVNDSIPESDCVGEVRFRQDVVDVEPWDEKPWWEVP